MTNSAVVVDTARLRVSPWLKERGGMDIVRAQRTEWASATNEGEPAEQPPEDFFATPEDLPYEVKSYPQDRVTRVNTPHLEA